MAKYTLNHVRLALDERKHLDMDHCQRQARLRNALSVERTVHHLCGFLCEICCVYFGEL